MNLRQDPAFIAHMDNIQNPDHIPWRLLPDSLLSVAAAGNCIELQERADSGYPVIESKSTPEERIQEAIYVRQERLAIQQEQP